MSAETLERSVLEGKDRDQLIAIATALGLKALSRAKKGDIIDRILEQTGSPNGGEANVGREASPEGNGASNGAPAGDDTAGEGTIETARANDDGPAEDEPLADWDDGPSEIATTWRYNRPAIVVIAIIAIAWVALALGAC